VIYQLAKPADSDRMKLASIVASSHKPEASDVKADAERIAKHPIVGRKRPAMYSKQICTT